MWDRFSSTGGDMNIAKDKGMVLHTEGSQSPAMTGQHVVANYGVPPELFAQYVEELGVTKSALISFFRILEQEMVPLCDLDSKLREIAWYYKELLLKSLVVNRKNKEDVAVNQLEKASKLRRLAKKNYTETLHEVSKTGNAALLMQLSYIHVYLDSENLNFIFQKEEWDSFNEIMNSIFNELLLIKEAASRCRASRDDNEMLTTVETCEERACRILCVPTNATNDQIKRVRNALATIWHPDAGCCYR